MGIIDEYFHWMGRAAWNITISEVYMRFELSASLEIGQPVFNIAHRGARAFAPENTLASFKKAKDFDCEMFELDVHLSKEGELIVHHDDQLIRCTDVQKKFPGRDSYYVSDFTLDELHSLDAGSWFVEQINLPASQRQGFLQTLTHEEIQRYISLEDQKIYASGAIKIPTLKQALQLAQALGMKVNIEIKTLPRMYPGITDAVLNLVKCMDMDQSVLISSFDHEQLLRARQLSNRIATAVLTGDRLANPGDYLRLLDADAYHPGCHGDHDSMGFASVKGVLHTAGILNVREKGKAVNVWTCNDQEQMRQLIEAGVSGLITDYPNRLQDVLS